MTVNGNLRVIEDLKALDVSKYPGKEIKDLIQKIKPFPVSAAEFHRGNVIYRVRPNEGSKSFVIQRDLSYKPQEYNTTYQRASSPSKTMFYGSIIPQANQESEIDIGRLIAAAEGSKVFRRKDISSDEQIVTFGMWRLHATVALGTILHPDLIKNVSPFAIERASALVNWLREENLFVEARPVLEFYAAEFSKLVEWGEPDYNYIHSALLTEFLQSRGLHGVIYPSGRVEGKGLNVAISPDFVDAHMRLDGAAECLIIKNDKKIGVEFLKIAWLNPGDAEIKWTVENSYEQAKESILTEFKKI